MLWLPPFPCSIHFDCNCHVCPQRYIRSSKTSYSKAIHSSLRRWMKDFVTLRTQEWHLSCWGLVRWQRSESHSTCNSPIRSTCLCLVARSYLERRAEVIRDGCLLHSATAVRHTGSSEHSFWPVKNSLSLPRVPSFPAPILPTVYATS